MKPEPKVETDIRITQLEIAWEVGGTWCLLNLDNRGQDERPRGFLRTRCPCCSGSTDVGVNADSRHAELAARLQPVLESLSAWCRRSSGNDLERAAARQDAAKKTGGQG